MLHDRGHKSMRHTIAELCIKTCSKQFQIIVHTFVTLPKTWQDFPDLPALVNIFTEQVFVLTYISALQIIITIKCQHIKLI